MTGNLPHIHKRIVNHKRSLASILSMGLSKRHRTNPIASLCAESIFSTPVLFSGMASLFLTKSESDMLACERKYWTTPETPPKDSWTCHLLSGRQTTRWSFTTHERTNTFWHDLPTRREYPSRYCCQDSDQRKTKQQELVCRNKNTLLYIQSAPPTPTPEEPARDGKIQITCEVKHYRLLTNKIACSQCQFRS